MRARRSLQRCRTSRNPILKTEAFTTSRAELIPDKDLYRDILRGMIVYGCKVTNPKCGAKGHDKIHREQFVNQDDGTILNTVAMQAKSTEDMTSDEELIADFRKRLSGKKLEVFDYIMLKGFDRDGCKNYIKEIAEKMGVGQANINLRLRAIKKELKEYLAEIEEMDKYIESKLG